MDLLATLGLGLLPWLTGTLAAHHWLAHTARRPGVLVGLVTAQALLYGALAWAALQ